MRALKIFLATASALLLGVTMAPSAHAAGGKYVALGDSYTVGVGTKTYDNPDDACRRGPLSYSRLWAAQHPDYNFVEASCSGDSTVEMLANQVPQLTPDTSLVTVQVGGNDVGFVDVLTNCVLTIDDADCLAGVEASKAAMAGYLPGQLQQVYSAIRAGAPSAKVVAVGYPRLYAIGGNCGIFGLSDTERAALNSAADTISDVISAAAAQAGFTYLDPRPAFDAHSICSDGNDWVTSLEWSKINESYHPNTEGHRDGYLALLNGITG
ncbi:SGNH/GDSL hydrolase family protein [Streptomyces sp. ITFR-6]|uniref:SGNH/GDSL hydrolase family protein n=1 Tax=Streptomyces sp. ITFR-6 TaxID=3075197 RepID=UPI002889A49C|nr:SGNH/GDSL hydrolase family protein [Streptomyces sp. ITFR-6]WNI32250.1 SGNH/GDSL hydrolase family protein [Streptomyces sp. ITFR-6]